MSACENCGALPGEECRHDLGCVDADRSTLESATPSQGTPSSTATGVADSSVEPGLCQCGCGERTRLSPSLNRGAGYAKGEPYRFVQGHQNRGRTGRRLSPEHREKIAAGKRGERNPRWGGGGSTRERYVLVFVGRGAPMANVRGYAREHRVVMAEIIGRPLERAEHVHHINDDGKDNRPENLWLFPSNSAHRTWHAMIETGRELDVAMAAVALAPLHRLVCSWCTGVMREGVLPTSHGICDPCMALHFPAAASLAVRVACAAWEKYASPQLRLDGAA